MSDTTPDEIDGLTLVLGGVRSGKSLWAESEMNRFAGRKFYLATAENRADDPELAERIRKHKERRGEDWRLIEESERLARAIAEQVPSDAPLLVECLSLWLARMMENEADGALEIDSAADSLLAALAARTAPSLVVSCEVGLGLLPPDRLARRFADAAGRLNQRVAVRAARVVWIAAGLARPLKPAS